VNSSKIRVWTTAGVTQFAKTPVPASSLPMDFVRPITAATRILEEFTPEQVQYMVDRIPVGRTGEISEIAALVAWLSSDECSFSTGAVFDISGGRATY
jgi:3-oxoacyl-[acyl-carrier protein] reductase